MERIARRGLAAFEANRQLWFYLYLTKLGLALVVSIPALITMQSALDDTLYSTPLLKEWSLRVIGELIAQRPYVFGSGFVVLIVFSFIVLVIRQFLNGGIYLAYSHIRRITRSEFFSAAGDRFGIHLRITGIMIIILLLTGGIGLWLGSALGNVIGSMLPQSASLTPAISLGVTGLALTLAIAFSDTIRSVAIHSANAPIRTLLIDAFACYRHHWVKLVAVYLVLFVLFALLWLGVERLALVATGGLANKVGIVIEMTLFQLCSFVRTGQSLLFTASVVSAYQDARTRETERRQIEVPVD